MMTFKRRAGRGILFLLLAVTLLWTAALAASAADALVYTTKDQAPFTVLASDGEGGNILPEDLSLWKASGKNYYLFLPGTADRTAVSIRYDGKLVAYDRQNWNEGVSEGMLCNDLALADSLGPCSSQVILPDDINH